MKLGKVTSRDLELLSRYDDFLLHHGFVDTDIDGEGVESQSSVNMFLSEWDEYEVSK